MSKPNACLAIGVGDAPPLDYLRGAVNGAVAMAAWADCLDYETILLTDRETPVEFEDVEAALTLLLENKPHRLIVYFAGHGLSKAVADDMWLLSRWSKTEQAVSINLLRHRFYQYRLAQLVIVSDACRTPVDGRTQGVYGNPVIKPGPYRKTLPMQDSWYSAGPARAAWMIPGRIPAETRCIFSGVLQEALAGCHSDAFDGTNVTNFSLADFMQKKVPEVAARYEVELDPWIETAIRPPDNIYLSTKPPTPKFGPWPELNNEWATVMAGGPNGRIEPPPGASWTTRVNSSMESYGWPYEDADLRKAMDAMQELLDSTQRQTELTPKTIKELSDSGVQAVASEKKRVEHAMRRNMHEFQQEIHPVRFEAGAILVVNGGEVRNVRVGEGIEVARVGDAGVWCVEPQSERYSGVRKISRRMPLPLLVQLEHGEWIGAAAIPEFVLSFTLSAGVVSAAIYRPVEDPVALQSEEVMARLRAGGLRREHAPAILSALLQSKCPDPMLGVMAAYLYEAMGDIDNVRRTASCFARRNQPIPFDIALLGQLESNYTNELGIIEVVIPAVAPARINHSGPDCLSEATPSGKGVVAGAFPFLRQGWGLLDPKGGDALYPKELGAIGKHLKPANFTTLTAEGGAELEKLLFGQSQKVLLKGD